MNARELSKNLVHKGRIRSKDIREAIAKVDRGFFVPRELRQRAYEDIPLPIGYGATISQPSTVAFMLEKLQARPGDKILDIGSGSGWTSALLAEIVGESGQVFAVEIVSELSKLSEKTVRVNYPHFKKRISFISQNAAFGLPEHAPFNGIIASAALSGSIPEIWRRELYIGGRIVAPVGEAIYLVERSSENSYKEEVFPGFVFVPFQYDE